MMNVGTWRWPLVMGLPLIAGGLLFATGVVRLRYQGQAVLAYSGDLAHLDVEPAMFKAHPDANVTFEKVPGQPLQIAMKSEGVSPDKVVEKMGAVGQVWGEQSQTRQRIELKKMQESYQKQATDLDGSFNQLRQQRQALLSGPKRNTPRANLVAEIEALKTRRQNLIERYPTHTDIPMLAKQIQELLKQRNARPMPQMGKVVTLDRLINETKLRRDYFARRAQDVAQAALAVKPSWKILQPLQKPARPYRADGWPIGAGSMAGVFMLSLLGLKGKAKAPAVSNDGLWKPAPVDVPVELTVVSPEPVKAVAAEPEAALPSDPMTEKAAGLYAKWVEVAKILYAPAAQPPQNVLDSVTPLLQESSEFLPEGHDVMARYLARSVVPGDLPAHVARTVLMTLTGAQEAGVSPEHKLAMALAALFHDLAVVPRPSAQQDEVGSEVGRLSATVLRRMPELQPALLSMVEDILIGMDEFKLDTWQNGAIGNTLEPLSKVLREIDRFEKVMQKQKSRLDRRVANQ